MLDTDQLRSFAPPSSSHRQLHPRRAGWNKTQSAVSMQIRRLEDQLGSPLFAKRGRGVRLTESGERLVDYARARCLAGRGGGASAEHLRGPLAGRVRLGIPDDYADTPCPTLITRFSRRHPLVELRSSASTCATLVEQIAGGDLDVAIYDGEREMELLREEPLRGSSAPIPRRTGAATADGAVEPDLAAGAAPRPRPSTRPGFPGAHCWARPIPRRSHRSSRRGLR